MTDFAHSISDLGNLPEIAKMLHREGIQGGTFSRLHDKRRRPGWGGMLGLIYAVKSGVGVGALPTAIADSEPDLVRVLGPIAQLVRSWRLLTHADLRRSPRIVAFLILSSRIARL